MQPAERVTTAVMLWVCTYNVVVGSSPGQERRYLKPEFSSVSSMSRDNTTLSVHILMYSS